MRLSAVSHHAVVVSLSVCICGARLVQLSENILLVLSCRKVALSRAETFANEESA